MKTLNELDLKNIEKLKHLYEKESFLTALGVYFGFPDCCIETFIDRRQFEAKEFFADLPSTGTGYMPCLCCAKEVHNDWGKFQDKINQNRICPKPFPNEPSMKSVNLFIFEFTILLGFDPYTEALDLARPDDILKLLPKKTVKKTTNKM